MMRRISQSPYTDWLSCAIRQRNSDFALFVNFQFAIRIVIGFNSKCTGDCNDEEREVEAGFKASDLCSGLLQS